LLKEQKRWRNVQEKREEPNTPVLCENEIGGERPRGELNGFNGKRRGPFYQRSLLKEEGVV